MHAQDKKQIERANARNAVEEYVYDMKDKLETIYMEFITEQVLYCDVLDYPLLYGTKLWRIATNKHFLADKTLVD